MSEDIRSLAYGAVRELCEKAGLRPGQIMVIGCSSSEIVGGSIGKSSSPETANEVLDGAMAALGEKGVFLAAQCCEHLNRAIVIERRALPCADAVNAVPKPKAGGSFAAAAYERFEDPILVEEIKADAGLDIGDTLIGMHLKKVAVPVRLSISSIGSAHITAARTRPKFIGGERACYDEKLK